MAERAKEECTIAYDTLTVFHDAALKVWRIVFSAEEMLEAVKSYM